MAEQNGTRKLTERQDRFAAEYVVDLNGAKAAERAGYAAKGAAAEASRLLRNPKVQAAISKRKAGQLSRADVTADRVLVGLGRAAFADVRRLFDDEGNLKPIEAMDDDTVGAIASFERRPDGSFKIRLKDSVRALELLLRHLSVAGNADVVKTDFITMVQQVRERLAALPPDDDDDPMND